MLGGGGAARAGGGDASPLEMLLPLLQGSGVGGKGAGKAISLLSTVLAYQRRIQRVFRLIKPYVPLLFWALVLWMARPLLLTHGVPFVRSYLPSWLQGFETARTVAALPVL